MIFLDNLINGLSLGSIYAIIALGYTMVYGIATMLNFAHGDIIMVGAYIAFCALQYWGLSPIPALLAAMVVCTVLGVTIEALAYRPLRKVAGLAVLITAIGMSYLLQNVALMIWGANPKSFPRTFINSSILHIGGLNISSATIYTILTNVVIMAALTLFTAKTKMGKAMRCVSEGHQCKPHHFPDFRHRLCSCGYRRRAAVFLLSHPAAYHRLHAWHQGIHRGCIRRHRFHTGRHAGRCASGCDRDLRQGIYFHRAW